MLTSRQKQIKDFIDKIILKSGVAPTEREIARYFRISPSTAHEHLTTLQSKGYLEKDKGRARGIKITNYSGGLVRIPLLGTIAAGAPIEAIQNPETILVPKGESITKEPIQICNENLAGSSYTKSCTVTYEEKNVEDEVGIKVIEVETIEAAMKWMLT